MDKLPDVPALRMLEPPAGGLERLRERLASRRRRWWLVAVPAALAVAALLLLVLDRAPAPPTTTASVPPTKLRDVAVARDGTFYWVASTPGPRASAAGRSTISIDDVPVVTEYRLPANNE